MKGSKDANWDVTQSWGQGRVLLSSRVFRHQAQLSAEDVQGAIRGQSFSIDSSVRVETFVPFYKIQLEGGRGAHKTGSGTLGEMLSPSRPGFQSVQ